MTIKSDLWLRRMAEEHNMISPFLPELVRETDGRKIISAGASSYGYDMRLADDGFKVFSPVHIVEIDPKKFDDASLIEPPLKTAEDGAQYYLLPPHHYGLGVTVETFKMPRNVTGVALRSKRVGPVAWSLRSVISPICLCGFTSTKASARSSSSNPTKTAPYRTPTAAANTRDKPD
jgi:hypothetical protein